MLGQNKEFKTYSDSKCHFSFDIPSIWEIANNTDTIDFNTISICKPTTKEELDSYKDCFGGIIFYIFRYDTSLDKTLQEEGYRIYDDTYYTTDRVNDSVQTENIKGENWIGIYHNNICGISCEETGFHAAAGQCEFFYFSDGRMTICITTNGHSFDENIKIQLLKTFKFN
jgi:hypothetical protein